MSISDPIYDVAIIGGGLAGLATAIEQAEKGRKVILFEKKTYPFHKVCGEYISNESWNYLKFLGLPLEEWNLPQINQLKVSSAQGKELNQKLKKGGFGISRYFLDHNLFELAKKKGVKVLDNTEITETTFKNDHHYLKHKDAVVQARLAVGSFGKRSKLDKQLNRNHLNGNSKTNYIAVKYHVQADLPENLIGLHIFKNGYCGISKVEGDNCYCMCYLTLASELKDCNNSIEELERKVLSKNKYLAEYLDYPRFLKEPEVIAQVNFESKETIEDHMYMLGDAAGLITPLCGNGMSMALHAAHEFCKLSDEYFSHTIKREELERRYTLWWKKEFNLRLKIGRSLQALFYNANLLNPVILLLSKFKGLSKSLIALTHGKDIIK